MKVNIALGVDASSEQYEVDIRMGCLDLVYREPLQGRFVDFSGVDPRWKAMILAARDGRPLITVSGRGYRFDWLDQEDGRFRLMPYAVGLERKRIKAQ
jgi:hypothetical protein